jgi:drug/metabolite transporter (DMT)-like permease
LSPVVLLLILCTATAHASWNLAAKRAGSGGATFVWLYTVISLTLYLPLNVVLLVVTRPALDIRMLGVIAVSAIIQLGYFVCLQRGYAVGDLSVVYPLARGTGPALAVLLAVLLLGERPHPLALLGTAGVVTGVLVVGLGRRTPAQPGDSAFGAGIGYGIATGMFIGGYTVWDAHAVGPIGVPPVLLVWGDDLVRAIALAPVAFGRRGRLAAVWKAHRREAFAIAVLAPLAYILTLIALTKAPVSLVAPARELSIVIASLFGWLALGEEHPVRRLTGALIILGGVAALAVS